MFKAYKYRIYPNKTQTVLLNKTFGCVRYFWNKQVETFNSNKGFGDIAEDFNIDFLL